MIGGRTLLFGCGHVGLEVSQLQKQSRVVRLNMVRCLVFNVLRSLLLSSGTRRSLCPLDSAHSLPIESPRRERLIREEGEGRPYLGEYDSA